MASGNEATQTTVVTGTAQEVEAQIATIKANGGTLISVRVLKPADAAGSYEVEIKHD